MKSYIKTLLSGTAALVLAFGMALPQANAVMILTLDDLSTLGIDVIVVDDVDGGIGFLTPKGASNTTDGSVGDGLLTFNGSVGTFIVNVTTGLSKPILGSPSLALIDLNSVNVSGGTAGTLELMLTDTDFSVLGQTTIPIILTSNIGGTTNGTVTSTASLDSANAAFGASLTIGPNVFTGPTFAGSVSAEGPILGAGLFSLSQTVRITHTSGGQITSFDHGVNATVPEPGTMLLMGSGLLGLGLWRKFKK